MMVEVMVSRPPESLTVSVPSAKTKVSLPRPPMSVSSSAPPSKVSLPSPPSRMLAAPLPMMALFSQLPVPLIAPVPCSVRRAAHPQVDLFVVGVAAVAEVETRDVHACIYEFANPLLARSSGTEGADNLGAAHAVSLRVTPRRQSPAAHIPDAPPPWLTTFGR